MPVIQQQQLWTRLSTPNSAVEIDWTQPIAKDLQRAWYATAPGYEAVSRRGVNANSVTPIPGLGGAAVKFNSASAAIDLGVVAAVARPITLRVRFISPTAGSASYLLACMPATSGSGWRLEASTTGGGLYPVLTYNAVANYAASAITIPAFGRQMITDYVVTMSASTITHYADGALLNSAAAASFTSAAAGSTLKIGAASGLAQVMQVEYWGRVLEVNEIVALYKDPKLLIKSRETPVFFPISGTQTYTYTATGGITFGGSATEERHKVQSVSGGLQFGGSASVSFVGLQTLVVTPSGGLTFGGSSTQSVTRPESVSGGIQFGGSATVTTHESVRTVTPSGGITFGGSASVVFPSLMTLFPYRRFIYGRKGLLDRKISRQ